jgi:hypothetical protein
MRAEDLPAGLGRFRAVTFAASFHWMDRPRVAAAVATMLDPGGAVVQVDAPSYRTGELAAEARRGTLPFPPPPDDALDELRRQYLGSDRRAGSGIRNTSPSGEDGVFQAAGFLPPGPHWTQNTEQGSMQKGTAVHGPPALSGALTCEATGRT